MWWDVEGAVRSVALSGTMCWNGNSNNNNSHVKKGPPPDEAVDVGVKHSSEPSVPLPPHKDEESSTAAVKQSTKVSAIVQKPPPLCEGHTHSTEVCRFWKEAS